MIAVSHPGKLGDVLYCLPTVRYLCEKYDTKADFFTSSYCTPLVRFLEYQSCIRKVVIPRDYVIRDAFCGVQPWEMPIPKDSYQKVFQLGFQKEPDQALPDFIAQSIGAPTGLPISYDYLQYQTLAEPYMVIAPGKQLQFRDVLCEVIRRSTIPIVVIGARDECLGEGIDKTGLDFLETVSWIASARAFLGTMSSQLVIANGFPIPKIVLDDGFHWDMRHVVHGPWNSYPVNPSSQQILSLLGIINYSKTLHLKDYTWIGEAEHITNILSLLDGIPLRFEHLHRRWEYGLALHALRENQTKTLLEVGGGGSAFAPSAAWLGMEVTQVDVEDLGEWIRQQAQKIRVPMMYIQKDFLNFDTQERFDAVTCFSVIEHVLRETDFFLRLLQYIKVGGLLILTTDFHPSGTAIVKEHLRTYNERMLFQLISLARANGFESFGPKPDYTYHGANVNSYTFASLVMKKVR